MITVEKYLFKHGDNGKLVAAAFGVVTKVDKINNW